MDERTRTLISLGAAVAAKCLPCFDHYLQKAIKAGIEQADLQEAIEVGKKLDRGAALSMRRHVETLFDRGAEEEELDQESSDRSCCCS